MCKHKACIKPTYVAALCTVPVPQVKESVHAVDCCQKPVWSECIKARKKQLERSKKKGKVI